MSIANLYDQNDHFDSPGQEALAACAEAILSKIPAGLLIRSGGGKGLPTLTPWIGVLDPNETLTPQSGIYFVYIFSVDLGTATLALLQGTDVGHHKPSLTRAALRADSAAIRAAMSHTELGGFTSTLDLGTTNSRQQRYKAGTIAAKTYKTDNLPSERSLSDDLQAMLRLYREAVEAKRLLLLSNPGSIHAPGLPLLTSGTNPFHDFKPKNDSDYEQSIVGRKLKKSRGHETLISQFGKFARAQGFNPATNVHPRDLTLQVNGVDWLVEAKTVGSQPADAVRSAIGQLFEYEFMMYSASQKPRKLALFSESVGDAFVDLLESLDIASIWSEDGVWVGSPRGKTMLDAVS